MKRKNENRRKKTGRRIQMIGLLFGILALLLAGTGLVLDIEWQRRDIQAGERSEAVLDLLQERISKAETKYSEEELSEQTDGNETEEKGTSDYFFESEPEAPCTENQVDIASPIPERIPYEVIDGIFYMGILTVPSLSLELPVILLDEWVPERMDIAPCTYDGSLKTHDLIIMAHNYAAHFRGLLDMQAEQEVILETVDKTRYVYTVTAVDIIHRNQRERLYEGEWDLTLFTCVPQTYNRCVVRCKLVLMTKE